MILGKFRLLGLDAAHAEAALMAWAIKRYPSRLLEILAEVDRPQLQLVVDALNGKRTRQHLNTIQAKIMRAHDAAEWECGRRYFDGKYNTWDFSKTATLFRIRMQYAKFEGLQPPPNPIKHRRWLRDLAKRGKIPQDTTFQRIMRQCQAEFRLEKSRRSNK